MGDGLGQKLYEALQAQHGVAFACTLTWEELTQADRDNWDRVAVVARKHMHEQCAAHLRSELEQVPGYAAHEVAMDLADKCSPLS
jgi:hypothetical protein